MIVDPWMEWHLRSRTETVGQPRSLVESGI